MPPRARSTAPPPIARAPGGPPRLRGVARGGAGILEERGGVARLGVGWLGSGARPLRPPCARAAETEAALLARGRLAPRGSARAARELPCEPAEHEHRQAHAEDAGRGACEGALAILKR